MHCAPILDARCCVSTRARHCRIRLTGCVGKHLTWARASWPLTHGQAGSRWQRGAGCSTLRSSVAVCNATERAASAFCCWLCFLFSSKESPPSLALDLRLRSIDGSSKVLFYIDPIVLIDQPSYGQMPESDPESPLGGQDGDADYGLV